MTRKEIADMVGSVGLPFAYYVFPPDENGNVDQTLPACIFFDMDYPDMDADNTHYRRIAHYAWELYEDEITFTLGDTIETVLQTYGIPYVRQGTEWFDDQRYYATVFTFTVFLDEDEEENNNGE